VTTLWKNKAEEEEIGLRVIEHKYDCAKVLGKAKGDFILSDDALRRIVDSTVPILAIVLSEIVGSAAIIALGSRASETNHPIEFPLFLVFMALSPQ
jgi:hypothetical protein